jgi:hypothetical protein
MALRLLAHVALPIDQRGALMNAREIAAQVIAGKVSGKWVLANVPAYYRHKIGRGVLYYENEVRQWLDSTRVM